MLALTTEAAQNGDVSTRVRLLLDCRAAFADHDAIPTAVLLEWLRRDSEAPWGDYGLSGLTAMKLGKLLREYDIHSANIRFPGLGQAKGYHRADFTDAWTRYCPTTPNGPPVEGQAVPAVPASSPQVSAGRLENLGRLSRPAPESRTSLTSTNEAGTAGTATPAPPALRVVGGAG